MRLMRTLSIFVLLLSLRAATARAELIWLGDWQVTRSGEASASFQTTDTFEHARFGAQARADFNEPSNDYDGSVEVFRAFEIRNAPAGGLDVTVEFLAWLTLERTPVGMDSGVDYSVDFAGLDGRSESLFATSYGTTDFLQSGFWTRTFQNGEQGYIRAIVDPHASYHPDFAGGIALAASTADFDLYVYPAGSVVPEPSGLALLGMGMAGVAGWRAMRRLRRVRDGV